MTQQRLCRNNRKSGGMHMPFDYKKEYKEFYLPKAKPEIVEIPAMNYLAIRGIREIDFMVETIRGKVVFISLLLEILVHQRHAGRFVVK